VDQRYPDWKETHDYMRFVADKCDMWPHIQLNTESSVRTTRSRQRSLEVTTRTGDTYTCKYFISAMGMISEPVIPKIEGMDRFKGPLFHSSRWPRKASTTPASASASSAPAPPPCRWCRSWPRGDKV
jgi:cation diffusion facilitator CzcD-associated flavoprotein CzcO